MGIMLRGYSQPQIRTHYHIKNTPCYGSVDYGKIKKIVSTFFHFTIIKRTIAWSDSIILYYIISYYIILYYIILYYS